MPGAALNQRWCTQADMIAGYLNYLRDARGPVLWRPYHEINGSWFCWSRRKGKGGSEALYRTVYDYDAFKMNDYEDALKLTAGKVDFLRIFRNGIRVQTHPEEDQGKRISGKLRGAPKSLPATMDG